MKRFPELKPNFWDVTVVLAVVVLASLRPDGLAWRNRNRRSDGGGHR